MGFGSKRAYKYGVRMVNFESFGVKYYVKKINYQLYFVALTLFAPLSTAANANHGLSDADLVAARAEFRDDLRFVCQLYSKWIKYKCTDLKNIISQMVQLYEMNLLQNDYLLKNENLKTVRLALIFQGENLENKFNKELEQLKASIGDKGYFYSWYHKDSSWLDEGIDPEEKQKFLEISHQKSDAFALLCHLAELDYRYYGLVSFSLGFCETELCKSLFQRDQAEFIKKIAGRNGLHLMLFSHLKECKNLDTIIKQDLANSKTLMLASKGDHSYAYLSELEEQLEISPDFELSEKDLFGVTYSPISKMDVFENLI
jgi:hypothetical protein